MEVAESDERAGQELTAGAILAQDRDVERRFALFVLHVEARAVCRKIPDERSSVFFSFFTCPYFLAGAAGGAGGASPARTAFLIGLIVFRYA